MQGADQCLWPGRTAVNTRRLLLARLCLFVPGLGAARMTNRAISVSRPAPAPATAEQQRWWTGDLIPDGPTVQSRVTNSTHHSPERRSLMR